VAADGNAPADIAPPEVVLGSVAANGEAGPGSPWPRVMGAHELVSALGHRSREALVVLAADGRVEYASPSCRTLFGDDLPDGLGLGGGFPGAHGPGSWIHPDDQARLAELLAHQLAAPEEVVRAEVRGATSDGGWRHIELVVVNRLDDPLIGGIVVSGRDLTDDVEAQRRLAFGATHDSLTGLANRTLLDDRMAHALARAERSGVTCGVLFVGLDGFGQINDSFGHRAGDEVLVEVARRLEALLSTGQSVARFGNDEFVVVAEDVESPFALIEIAEKVQVALTEPIHAGGRQLVIHCSIGIGIAAGGTPGDLLQDADTALHRAKMSGRGRWEVYDRAMRAAVQQRLATEGWIRATLADGGLSVLYQPIVGLADGRLVGTEALARLWRSDGGLAPPGEFMDVAEQSGLVVPLGRAVVREACRQQASWLGRWGAAAPGYVSVNISGQQLTNPGLEAVIREALDESGLPAEHLVLELTEAAHIDVEVSYPLVDRLRRVGVRFALDDFGTGWSSLTHLRSLPIEMVKIDRSFILGLGVDEADTAMVKAMVGLAHALGMMTVAEGVESIAQVEWLRGFGCDMAQGYLYSAPLPPRELHPRPGGDA
jgi:diguanylate cyclase (GGDEF)-like protein